MLAIARSRVADCERHLKSCNDELDQAHATLAELEEQAKKSEKEAKKLRQLMNAARSEIRKAERAVEEAEEELVEAKRAVVRAKVGLVACCVCCCRVLCLLLLFASVLLRFNPSTARQLLSIWSASGLPAITSITMCVCVFCVSWPHRNFSPERNATHLCSAPFETPPAPTSTRACGRYPCGKPLRLQFCCVTNRCETSSSFCLTSRM